MDAAAEHQTHHLFAAVPCTGTRQAATLQQGNVWLMHVRGEPYVIRYGVHTGRSDEVDIF